MTRTKDGVLLRIDAHAHWYPEDTVVDLVRHCSDLSVRHAADGTLVVLVRGSVATMIGPGSNNWSERLSRMDALGVNVEVLSYGALDVSWAGSYAPRIVRRVNEGMAEVCRAADGRFRFLAAVPAAAGALMDVELEYALGLGAIGVATTTTVGGRTLDSTELLRFWSFANELGLPILVHPSYPPWAPSDDDGPFLLAGFIGETTLAASRFVLTGMLNRFPRLRVIWSHVGGALPMFVERLQSAASRFPASGGSPAAALGRCWFDTVCTHGPALDCARSTFGASQLVFGTDEPHGLEQPHEILRAIRERPWPEAEVAAVLGGNAAHLFGLAGPSPTAISTAG